MGQAFFLRFSGVLGLLAVVFGAFGAHGLESRLSEDMLSTYETAVRYHFYHVAAMLAVAVASPNLWTSAWTRAACWAWAAGIAVFSGSLYVLALSGQKWLGMITPIGGVAMMMGWVFIIFSAAGLSRAAGDSES